MPGVRAKCEASNVMHTNNDQEMTSSDLSSSATAATLALCSTFRTSSPMLLISLLRLATKYYITDYRKYYLVHHLSWTSNTRTARCRWASTPYLQHYIRLAHKFDCSASLGVLSHGQPCVQPLQHASAITQTATRSSNRMQHEK